MKLLTWTVVMALGLGVCCPERATADEFTASGTWNAGKYNGTWEGTLTRDDNVVSGRIQLAGGPVLVADAAGSLIGEHIEFGLISGQHEIASFDGTVSLDQLSGAVTMADGATGRWAGTWQPVSGKEAPITDSRAGTLTPPWDKPADVPPPHGDLCDLVTSGAIPVMSAGGQMALQARCSAETVKANGGQASTSSISCNPGPPESNPPPPGSVTGSLVNVLARPLQTWPHITQSEPSAVVSLVDHRKQTISYNDFQFINDHGSGIGFGYRVVTTGAWTQNPDQLWAPVGLLINLLFDPSGAADRDAKFHLGYISFDCTLGVCLPGIGMSTSGDGGFSYGEA